MTAEEQGKNRSILWCRVVKTRAGAAIATSLVVGVSAFLVVAANGTFSYYEFDLNSGAERRQIRMLGIPLRTWEIRGPRCDFGEQAPSWVHASAAGVFRRVSRTGIHSALLAGWILVEMIEEDLCPAGPEAGGRLKCDIMIMIRSLYFRNGECFIYVYPEYSGGKIVRLLAEDASGNEYELWSSVADPK